MKPYVLIVEDSSDFRFLLKTFLETEGVETNTANNGKLALEFLKDQTQLPSLILLDLMMPEMDGVTFKKIQEKDPRLSKIPVVIMTAGSHVEEKTIEVNAQGFLKKPIAEVDDLIKVVRSFLQ